MRRDEMWRGDRWLVEGAIFVGADVGKGIHYMCMYGMDVAGYSAKLLTPE